MQMETVYILEYALMNKSLKLGAAFIGVIVGAGFASGQELLQFFVSFGIMGFWGIAIATLLIGFLVMNLYQIGSKLQIQSHEVAMNHICGKWLGKIIDFMLTFFLFGIIVVMLSGAGSSLNQQFDINPLYGNFILAILTILTLYLGLSKMITTLAIVTPVLMAVVAVIAVYSYSTQTLPLSELLAIAEKQPKASSNWFMGSILYVSYNIAAIAAVLVVLGGSEKDERKAAWGGILGGLMVGALILGISLAVLLRLDITQDTPIPTLHVANQIAPWFGHVMFAVIFVELYCTTVALAFALVARCKTYGLNFNVSIIACMVLAFFASLVGFVKLVGLVYPIMGYLGFILIIAIIFRWFKDRNIHRKNTNT